MSPPYRGTDLELLNTHAGWASDDDRPVLEQRLPLVRCGECGGAIQYGLCQQCGARGEGPDDWLAERTSTRLHRRPTPPLQPFPIRKYA